MQRGHDCEDLTAEQLEELQPVADVEMVGRLVQDDDLGVLSEGSGQLSPLLFVAIALLQDILPIPGACAGCKNGRGTRNETVGPDKNHFSSGLSVGMTGFEPATP